MLNQSKHHQLCFVQWLLSITALLIFANGAQHMIYHRNRSHPRILRTVPPSASRYYPNDIHIFLSCDDSEKIALYTVINSIVIHHNTSLSRLYFHILVEYHRALYLQELHFLFPSYIANGSLQFEIKQFSNYPRFYQFYPKYVTANKENRRICKQMNFARFYFTDIFDLNLDIDHVPNPNPYRDLEPESNSGPNLKLQSVAKAIYLDVDMIVLRDIQFLYDHEVNQQVPITSPFYGSGYKLKSYNLFGRAVRHRKYVKLLNISKEMKSGKKGFNTGVYLYDLQFWINHNLTAKYEHFVKLNYEHNGELWTLGTQPILNLLYVHHRIGRLSRMWNIKNLGFDDKVSVNMLRRANLLHWNGERKPWTKDGIAKYKRIWLDHVPQGMNRETIANWSDSWDLTL